MNRSAAKTSRRTFLHTAATATGALLLPRAARAGAAAANERITVGVIGLGGRGFDLLNLFLREDDAQVVAVCDVHDLHYRDNAWEEGRPFGREAARQVVARYYERRSGTPADGIAAYSDFRALCARDDIDAVVVATPDHWHARVELEAMARGKDVYGEKPLTHFFAEGQAVYRAAAKQERVFQAGSHQRSMAKFRHAVEVVLNGHLGKLTRVEVGLYPGYETPMGDTAIVDPPAGLDYELWCGPGPRLPYMRARHHRWWRGDRAYGGGVLMDWIGHHNDIAHWGMGMERSGPVEVTVSEWTMPATEIYNTPSHFAIDCTYANGVRSSISSRNRGGTKFIGEAGWLWVDRDPYERVVMEASEPRWTEPDFAPGPVRAYVSERHSRNFLDCVRTREACIAPPEVAHRAITPGHLAYVAHALGRALPWDPATEVSSDAEAQALLMAADYRSPWTMQPES